MTDNFTKWMLGITASAVIIVGGGILSTIIQLREQMAKTELLLTQLEAHAKSATVWQSHATQTLDNHEYRIGTLEYHDERTTYLRRIKP